MNAECIVSSFPRSGSHSKYDLDNVQDMILGQYVGTVYELAALITSHCIVSLNDKGVSQTIGTSTVIERYDKSLQQLVSSAKLVFRYAL